MASSILVKARKHESRRRTSIHHRKLVRLGRGILAADESLPTIAKRFQAFGIANTEETPRAYRALLFTTRGAEEFISGAILFEETLGQRADDGTSLPEVLDRRGIVPGIKVDQGTTPLANAAGDLITQGLDGLPARLSASQELQGAAKTLRQMA